MSRTLRRKHTRAFFVGRIKDNGRLELITEGRYQYIQSGAYREATVRNRNYHTPQAVIHHFKVLWHSDNINGHNPPKSIKRFWIHKVRQDYKRDLRAELEGLNEGLSRTRYWQCKWYWYAF